jgi:hypothetical protein
MLIPVSVDKGTEMSIEASYSSVGLHSCHKEKGLPEKVLVKYKLRI